MNQLLEHAGILIVDDEVANVRLLEQALHQAGYQRIFPTTDPERVEALVDEHRPDLLLLDLVMPRVDGFEVMRRIRDRLPAEAYFPILVLTADATPDTKRKALASGATDFVTKPLDLTEVLLRVRNLVQTRRLHLDLQEHNQRLEDRVQARTRELDHAQIETLDRLALAAEFRDDATGQHIVRVGRSAAAVARVLGWDDGRVRLIERAAALHDIGKLAIPDAVLLKPAKLSAAEFETVKTHTSVGARILSGSGSPYLQMAEVIAQTHHERWDGGGYVGLAGEEIPEVGRITAVVDVFDALTHDRPYKQAWSVDRAVEEIRRGRGTQFEPRIVDAFDVVLEASSTVLVGGGGGGGSVP